MHLRNPRNLLQKRFVDVEKNVRHICYRFLDYTCILRGCKRRVGRGGGGEAIYVRTLWTQLEGGQRGTLAKENARESQIGR